MLKERSVKTLDERRPTVDPRGARASIGELVASRKFEYVVDGLLVANAIVVALQTRPQLMGKAPRGTPGRSSRARRDVDLLSFMLWRLV